MLARYEGAYAASTLIVMGDRSGFAWKDVPEYNYIDDAGLREAASQVKVLPSELCTDEEFIRRLYSRPDRPAAGARAGPSLPRRHPADDASSATS